MKKLIVFVFSVVLLGSCQKEGCTDPLATNFDENASQEDGSCDYTNSPYYTIIPDTNFENKLIEFGYDDVTDGKVLTSNINNVTELWVQYSNISDLTGIEDFVELKKLMCSDNYLLSLDLSNNTKLTKLSCTNNYLSDGLNLSNNLLLDSLSYSPRPFPPHLSTLNLNNNLNLKYLYVYLGKLTSLDLSNNVNLSTLICGVNQLTSLDLSNNINLIELECSNNQQLTCLNLKNGNNQNLELQAVFNQNLNCIEVDDQAYSTANWTNIDAGTTFSTNCNYPAGCF